MFSFEVCGEVIHEKSTVMGLLQWRPHDRSLSYFVAIPAFVRRTDGRTDGFTIAGTALWIASYADAL